MNTDKIYAEHLANCRLRYLPILLNFSVLWLQVSVCAYWIIRHGDQLSHVHGAGKRNQRRIKSCILIPTLKRRRNFMKKSESKYFNTALRMDQAFLELLEKKDLEYSTVKEICEAAGVNRSTFYLH